MRHLITHRVACWFCVDDQALGAEPGVGLSRAQYWEVIGKDDNHLDELVQTVGEVSRAKVSAAGGLTSHPLG
jgi:hypothetical protein